MTVEEQKAIYKEMHQMEVRLMKDNAEKHEDVINLIHELALTVKEHNGVKAIAEKNREDIACNKKGIDKIFSIINTWDGIKVGAAKAKNKGLNVFNIVIASASILTAIAVLILAFTNSN